MLGLCNAAGAASATTWYVDGLGGRQSNPGTQAAPFLYFWQANSAAKPGDTINVLPTITYNHLSVTTSGTSGKMITVNGAGLRPGLTRVTGGGVNFGIWINASYVTVMNFDVTAPGTHSGIFVNAAQHHVQILSNIVHDAGEDGISTYRADYLTISGNTVYGNARNTSGGIFASGISVKASTDIDSYTGLKIRVTGNLAYNNTNVPNCSTASCLASFTDPDGSGIILDDNRHTESDNIPYAGRFFVANNVAFGNGGRGIHLYQTDHVSVNGNTLYHNNQDPYEAAYQPGEITGYYVGDVSVYNNILDSDGGQGENGGQHTGHHGPLSFRYCTKLTGSLIVSGNLGFRPQNDPASFVSTAKNTIPLSVTNTVWGDPLFAAASLDPALADLRLTTGSPAVGAGNSTYYATQDALGVKRTVPITIGAYQTLVP